MNPRGWQLKYLYYENTKGNKPVKYLFYLFFSSISTITSILVANTSHESFNFKLHFDENIYFTGIEEKQGVVIRDTFASKICFRTEKNVEI